MEHTSVEQEVAFNLQTAHHVETSNPELLAAKVYDRLAKLGVWEKIAKVDKDRQALFARGVAALWDMDSNGRQIEQDDADKIDGRNQDGTAKNERVKEELDDINRLYHSSRYDWFDNSILQLTKLAASTSIHSEEEGYLKDSIFDGTYNYYTNLRRAGDSYRDIIVGHAQDQQVQIEHYLTQERAPKIEQMVLDLSVHLDPVIRSLKPLPRD